MFGYIPDRNEKGKGEDGPDRTELNSSRSNRPVLEPFDVYILNRFCVSFVRCG